jgi:cyclic beta-1,2-glucan synthetase
MGLRIHTNGVVGEEEHSSVQPSYVGPEAETLRASALELAARLGWLPGRLSEDMFAKRCKDLADALDGVFQRAEIAFAKGSPSEDLLWLKDNAQQLSLAARTLANELAPQTSLPVVSNQVDILPRVLAIALGFVDQVDSDFSKERFTAFCLAFEEHTPLRFHEIGSLVPSLKLVFLERVAENGRAVLQPGAPTSPSRVVPYIKAFREVAQSSWKDEIRSLLPFDPILRQDPAGAFAAMDSDSQNLCREQVARLAQRSDLTEMEVAREALKLAQRANSRKYHDPRIALRESHIGYYLIAEGAADLRRRVGYHPPFAEHVRLALKSHPDKFLLLGIAILSLLLITGILWLLTPPSTPLQVILISMLILALPTSQAAVQLMNYLTTNLLQPVILPKMDFSRGIPDDCITLVAVPTLLLNEKQVRRLVQQLEVRYVGNHDPNLHFAILSDLPDSHQPAPEDSDLVALCSRLIRELNDRYGSRKQGTFFHLHRHRVYNPREKGWMGWERKRGKLLDLNQFLRGHFDGFPVKIGDLSILPKVRYVITLDSDTELPRRSAQRMVGAIAHPLNQAIIDPDSNIVVAGYGILQPRVDISVECTASSRLAAIFVGETGLDPYSRASSDVYQDLYGEGSFTGKGIYEVDTMFRVLYGRFPRNSLLSHDLIEGAYARAGLVSDISVIEDYPSHYSAYNKRKHRWLRGDWQIVEWLTDTVPDESGARVRNPISLVSRWKILDNLRRSLVEPAILVLLLYGWFSMGHPIWWTVAAIGILFVPAWVELLFAFTRAVLLRQIGIVGDALRNLLEANLTVLLNLALLAHQTLLSLDAVVRTLVRRLVTRERLLEWETAAEAELGKRRTQIDRYIDWMPLLALALGALIWKTRPHSFWAALPILVLWLFSKPFVLWLNGSPMAPVPKTSKRDLWLLHKSTLHIWRYFAELSTEEHNWLIPDNLQEPAKIAASVSPTNIGLLLNARQVAVEFGYLTVPEMVDLTQKTLATVTRVRKYCGHLMNWYDTRSLEAKPPLFISSVDNGNLVASYWTLRQGCLHLLQQPLLSKKLGEGLLDHLRVLNERRAFPKRALHGAEQELRSPDWIAAVTRFAEKLLANKKTPKKSSSPDTQWFRDQARLRVRNIYDLIKSYMPWALPEFAAIRDALMPAPANDKITLEQLPNVIAALESRLDDTIEPTRNGNQSTAERLRDMLPEARQNAVALIAALRRIAQHTEELADAMDFKFLFDNERMLMSVGFDAQSKELQPYYYDLLATEPRTAIFISVAKDDIPQEAWFQLGRPFTTYQGRTLLLSWTGTMFEYMMPTIWMQRYPNTLLDRAAKAAVRAQQAYGNSKGIPWGISESACARINPAGDYHYEAFGVPTLAIKKSESETLIISPYSTFLALSVDPKGALANLRKMESAGWFGSYGFYEAADFTSSRKRLIGHKHEIVRSWMVHHQGMSLLSLANFLCDNVVQHWFHSDPRVQATALLLQEKPVAQLV